jgi:hypothetical protein
MTPIIHNPREESMFMKTIHSIIALLSTFVPFIVVVAAIVLLPNAAHTMAKVSGIEWIYLIAIGAMTLGSFYWLVELDVAAIRERLFKRLDVDHDGYIRRGDVAKAKDLIKVFDEIDTDHDGRLSRIEFSKALTSCGRVADFESYISHLLSGKLSID